MYNPIFSAVKAAWGELSSDPAKQWYKDVFATISAIAFVVFEVLKIIALFIFVIGSAATVSLYTKSADYLAKKGNVPANIAQQETVKFHHAPRLVANYPAPRGIIPPAPDMVEVETVEIAEVKLEEMNIKQLRAECRTRGIFYSSDRSATLIKKINAHEEAQKTLYQV